MNQTFSKDDEDVDLIGYNLNELISALHWSVFLCNVKSKINQQPKNLEAILN